MAVRSPRARATPGLFAMALLGSLLPGCPFSDKYFVEPNAAVAGSGGAASAGNGGTGGSAASAGSPAKGGSGANVGGSGGDGSGGTVGGTSGDGGTTGGTGGSDALGGTGGTDAKGGGGGTMSEAGADQGAGSGGGGTSGTGGTSSGCSKETEICDGVDNDCDDAVDEGSVCPENCTARRNDDHLYVLCVSDDSADALGADDASMRCPEIGTELGLEQAFGLAWIESSDENDFLKEWIKDTVPSDAVIWIAANDEGSEHTWVWGRRTTAEQFFTGSSNGGGDPYMDRFNDFAPGQPDGDYDDEDCGAFDPEFDWQWADEFCTALMPGFVCEEHPPAT